MDAIYNSWLYKFVAGTLNDVAWLYILLPCVFVGGLYFTVGSGFMQFRRFGYAMTHTVGKLFDKKEASSARRRPSPWAATVRCSGCGSPRCWA